MKTLQWQGCYDGNWNGLIVPDAFTHPAKFSRALVDRIFRFMLAEKMISKGDSVADPFGGIGTGGIVAASHGLRWFGCELEPKFAELGQKNFQLHLMTWQCCHDPIPVLVNGDSRKLRENLAGVRPQAVVCSPPYNLPMSQDHNGTRGGRRGTEPSEHGAFVKYGCTPGQLEGLPMGDIGAVVSSPPFLDARSDTTPSIKGATAPTKHDPEAWSQVDAVVSSPPYAGDSDKGDRTGDERARRRAESTGYRQGLGCFKTSEAYGRTDGQLGGMPTGDIDAVVTSPPYAASINQVTNDDSRYVEAQAGVLRKYYGSTLGNLGNMPDGVNGRSRGSGRESKAGHTFWQAAADIVAECFAILRPGGWSAWVVKDFVRNKARVPFCDDWCKLLESRGFAVEIRAHAMLVRETSHPDLFGGDDHIKTKERKSFFRRLAEKKGSPRIDWEEVVFARKPE